MTTQANQTQTPTTDDLEGRYMVWTGTTQARANKRLGHPHFNSDDLSAVSVFIDKLGSYRGPSFASIIDTNDGSVFDGTDWL